MQKRKPRVGILSRDFVEFACFKLRIADPLSLLAGAIDTYFYHSIERARFLGDYGFDSDEHFIASMDFFIVQRWFITHLTKPLIEQMLASGKPIVLEMDDWLPGLPPSNPMYEDNYQYVEYINWLMPQCHLVTVSTKLMAEKARSINPRVAVLRNAVSRHRVVEPMPAQDGQVVIGFAGTSTHGKDLSMIAPALTRIYSYYAGLVKFVFWGDVPQAMVGRKGVRLVPDWVMYHEYFAHLASLRLDIGLAPLSRDDFNDCKSDIKWLDYSIVGAASVVSDAPPYASLKGTGLAKVVENNPDAWFEAISELIENEVERRALATRAREQAIGACCLENVIGDYLDAWNSVLPLELRQTMPMTLGKPFLGRSSNSDQVSQLNYMRWLKNHNFREVHAEQLAERMMTVWQSHPLFNLIVLAPKEKQALLGHSITALEKQLYPHWRLLVVADWDAPDPVFSSSGQLGWARVPGMDDANAVAAAINGYIADRQADWTWLLPAGFRLQPQTLLRMGEAIHQNPDKVMVYCDSDVVSPMGERFLPAFRPDFSPDYLRSMDYIGHAGAFSTQALVRIGGVQPYPEAYSYDLTLRLLESYGPSMAAHIDDMLLSLPWVDPEFDHLGHASRQVALENHGQRCGYPVAVRPGLVTGTYHYEYQLQNDSLISIIIPNRDKLEVLEPCIEGLFDKTDYQNFELLVIDNRSEQPETLEYYQDLQQRYPDRVRILPYDAPFNFSAQCNMGVEQSRGEYVLLLNNDTEVVLGNWLTRMLATAQQPGVGAVGARLLYPEIGQVQHAGIVLGMPGALFAVAAHAFESQDINLPGYMNRAQTMQNYSAVTAACLLISKSVYQQVGGMDETNFQIWFNDVDFCVKVQQAGWRNVYNPYAVMYHHHGKTIKKVTRDPRVALEATVREHDEMFTVLERWLPLLKRDPGYNRHLSLRTRKMEPDADRHASWDPLIPGRKRVLGMPVPGGSGEYRLSMPLSVLQEKGKLDGEILQPMRGLPSIVELARLAPDTLLMHTAITDELQFAMQNYRRFLPQLRIVLGIDDMVGGLPLKSDLYDLWKWQFPDAKQRLRQSLKHCDALVVSTEPLLHFCKGMIERIEVIPNRLRKSVWQQLKSERRAGDKPRVGWVGASQHRGDLELLLEVMKQTHQEVDWVLMGMTLPQFKPYVKEFHQPVPFSQYPEKMASLNLDLAVAPLEVNPFNEAKSNLRLLEYGVLGWPVVCTDIYPYQSNQAPVCRVPNRAEAWVEAIRARVHDLDALAKDGDRLRAWVGSDYWLDDHYEDWLRVLHG
ncbi:glycosyltransferase [Chromobacterium phragmitis]|uniref:Glycosyltransferase n=2 Tax=Chromobacterium phragmitis TaxID=2202141 RepID=A0ABV0IXY2_9NEIS